jgi:hypothetical protein
MKADAIIIKNICSNVKQNFPGFVPGVSALSNSAEW